MDTDRISRLAQLLNPAWRSLLAATGIWLAIGPAVAVDPASFSYWISMRSITQEAAPLFVTATYNADSSHVVSFTACDGHNYYLSAADSAAVDAASAKGDTIQLHRANAGTQPSDAPIACLMQVSQ